MLDTKNRLDQRHNTRCGQGVASALILWFNFCSRINKAFKCCSMDKLFKAVNLTRSSVLCERLTVAHGMAEQSRGLLGRTGLEPGEGMLFIAGRLIPFMWMHMFFMRFPIDIVFLDRADRVIRIDRRLKPWRVSSLVIGARKALELAAGAADGTSAGDRIALNPAVPA